MRNSAVPNPTGPPGASTISDDRTVIIYNYNCPHDEFDPDLHHKKIHRKRRGPSPAHRTIELCTNLMHACALGQYQEYVCVMLRKENFSEVQAMEVDFVQLRTAEITAPMYVHPAVHNIPSS